MRRDRVLLLLGVTALICLPGLSHRAAAQSIPDTLITDRPGFTETTRVVGRGVLQMEFGAALELDGRGDERTRNITAPLALLRVGLTPRLELRVGDDGEVVSAIGRGPGHQTIAGGADVEFGAKWVVLDRPSAGFSLAVIPLISVPTGSRRISSGTYNPAGEVAWAKSLPHGFDLGGNVNVTRLRDVGGRYTQEAISVSLSRDWREPWSTYWEAYGLFDLGHHDAQSWSFDTGVSRTIGRTLEVDVEMGHGLSPAAADWFVGVGLGLRTHAHRR